ncbi:MAG: prephenate dehydrogenase [Planctomycetia bacterium]|nr:prephenate dehydrogenase [Planctomycetia bacterium]
MPPLFSHIIIVGVGLLGGSVGLAAKKHGVARYVIGLGRSQEKLENARQLGAIDRYATSWKDALNLIQNHDVQNDAADLPVFILFALPVELNLLSLDEFWRFRREPWFVDRKFIISDVGSVKSGFAQAADWLAHADDLPMDASVVFVPAHPIAGSDKSGVQYATDDLFDDKLVILTPWLDEKQRNDALQHNTAEPWRPTLEPDANLSAIEKRLYSVWKNLCLQNRDADHEQIAKYLASKIAVSTSGKFFSQVLTTRKFWQALGAFVVETSAKEHDQILARASHMPHLASVLTTSVLPLDELLFSGTGFRDVSRLAAGNPEVWTEIFSANRLAMLEALTRFEENLIRWKSFLKEDDRDSIFTFLKDIKKKRDALGS